MEGLAPTLHVEHRISIKGGKARLLPPRPTPEPIWENAQARYTEYHLLMQAKAQKILDDMFESMRAAILDPDE